MPRIAADPATPSAPPKVVSLAQAAILAGAFIAGLLFLGYLLRPNPALFRALVGAAGFLVVWAVALFTSAARTGRKLTLTPWIQRNHWVQMCAQGTVLLYWGWHERVVYAFFPLLLAQILFAFGVDLLLQWSRRDVYRMAFGPIPVMFSINLFLWFKPEWYHFQFVMIALGFLAKEFLRWTRDGRSVHIFNPSSFPLAVFSLVLVLTGTSDATFGQFIANTQHDPPYMYLVIFLVALPGQLLFGVARMTLAAVATVYGTSMVYLAVTGTYLFFDSHIPVPVFLGMHLLFTDPSTSPRSETGRVLFGILYALGTTALFVLLPLVGAPTFYDKLMPVPLMNLMVRFLDRLAASKPLARVDLAKVGKSLSVGQRNVAYTSVWAGVFTALSLTQGVGDRHPGQYLPFWQQACQTGNERACRYEEFMTLVYCNNGSGWACNAWAILQAEQRMPVGRAFQQACDLGFAPGCENVGRERAGPEALARGRPQERDLPIVLRGTKPALAERDPARLRAIACEQGWSEVCAPPS